MNADSFGNIYFGDTGNSRFRVVVGPVIAGVTNPLIAILQMNPTYSSITAASAAGKVYPIAGGTQFTAPASGAACSTGSSINALDGNGDGCPFYNTSVSTVGGFVQGVAVDSFGDFIFTDSVGIGRVRVLFAGGANNPMANVITVNNPTITTPQVGFVYSIAGGGSALTVRLRVCDPILASSASLDGNLFRVNTDAAGNIYVGDSTQILFIDINTGYIRKVAANNTVCAGADAFGDGCPATQSSFGGSTGVLGLALDNLGQPVLRGRHEPHDSQDLFDEFCSGGCGEFGYAFDLYSCGGGDFFDYDDAGGELGLHAGHGVVRDECGAGFDLRLHDSGDGDAFGGRGAGWSYYDSAFFGADGYCESDGDGYGREPEL